MDTTNQIIDRIVRDPEAKAISGLCRSRRDELSREGLFPKRIRISERACGYRLSELLDWVASRPRADDVRPDLAGNPRARGVGKKQNSGGAAHQTDEAQ